MGLLLLGQSDRISNKHKEYPNIIGAERGGLTFWNFLGKRNQSSHITTSLGGLANVCSKYVEGLLPTGIPCLVCLEDNHALSV